MWAGLEANGTPVKSRCVRQARYAHLTPQRQILVPRCAETEDGIVGGETRVTGRGLLETAADVVDAPERPDGAEAMGFVS